MLINKIAIPCAIAGAWICFTTGADIFGALFLALLLANTVIVWIDWKPKDE